ncbi:MAG: glycoside hydrolase family 43 protein [Sphaerochaeta sp.]|nr:glycoside hydrolase family 43 protein [Anaerolineaceae bacterium]
MRHDTQSLFYFFILLVTSCTHHGPDYTSPLKTTDGEYIPLGDPFVYTHKGVYYMTGTSIPDSGFNYYTSKDMVTWEFGGALFRPSEDHYGVGYFWAPEVKYYQDRFYLTYSSRDKESGLLLSALAVSDRPEGPFTELYAPWFNTGQSAIDCHIFIDDDSNQTPYLFYSQNGAREGYSYGENYVVKLNEELSDFAGDPVLVGKASQEWEKVDYDVNRCNEGVFALKHNGNYYITYSANHTSYSHYGVGTSKASHPLGPWIKDADNPILTSDDALRISSPGHSCIVRSPDGKELYIVYHAHRDYNIPKPSDDRIVYIDRVYFNRDGNLRLKR